MTSDEPVVYVYLYQREAPAKTLAHSLFGARPACAAVAATTSPSTARTAPTAQPSWPAVNATVAAGPAATAAATRRP